MKQFIIKSTEILRSYGNYLVRSFDLPRSLLVGRSLKHYLRGQISLSELLQLAFKPKGLLKILKGISLRFIFPLAYGNYLIISNWLSPTLCVKGVQPYFRQELILAIEDDRDSLNFGIEFPEKAPTKIEDIQFIQWKIMTYLICLSVEKNIWLH